MKKLSYFKNKKVLITGNTGFKGAWLSIFLKNLGAKLYGLSNNIPWKNGIFTKENINDTISQRWINIKNYSSVKKVIKEIKPDFIFHLAAQPLVLESFKNPRKTFLTNFNGTLNVLDSVRLTSPSTPIIIITSDKVYKNNDGGIFFDEHSELKGKDPYSASKSCSEIIAYSYSKSYENMRIATVRSGNVIGGGDWSNNRIIPDIVKSIKKNKQIIIRNPRSTRPWLYVLDVCKGYIDVAIKLNESETSSLLCYNLAPTNRSTINVERIAREFSSHLKYEKLLIENKRNQKKESNVLNLNCKKAVKELNWKNYFNLNSSINETAKWYESFLNNSDPLMITENRVKKFIFKLKELNFYNLRDITNRTESDINELRV